MREKNSSNLYGEFLEYVVSEKPNYKRLKKEIAPMWTTDSYLHLNSLSLSISATSA